MNNRIGRGSAVFLCPLTSENWKERAALSVDGAQKGLLPENLYSIAEAQFDPETRPRAIHVTDGGMVGFVLYGRDGESGSWKVYRLMVDRAYQGRGYGRAAMEAMTSELSGLRDCSESLVSYQKDNAVAWNLYTSLGFCERSCEGGKVTAVLDVGRQLSTRLSAIYYEWGVFGAWFRFEESFS